MARILYVGDIHGRLADIGTIAMSCDSKLRNKGEQSSIVQVGDFGFGFKDGSIRKWLEKRARKDDLTPIYTCMGNHDNWDLLYEMSEKQGNPDLVELFPNSKCYYVRRGALIDIHGISHLFLGGAESTDRHRRKDGVDWWSREEASKEEFEEFARVFEEEKPNTIVTHDVPIRVELYRARRNQSITPNILEKIYKDSKHKPRRHYFGHHHLLRKWKISGTKFYCCGLHGQYYERISK